MVVKLNDKLYEIGEGTTLDRFVESLGIRIQGFAVAVNYEVVPKSQWSAVMLVDGMELVMIHAVSGG